LSYIIIFPVFYLTQAAVIDIISDTINSAIDAYTISINDGIVIVLILYVTFLLSVSLMVFSFFRVGPLVPFLSLACSIAIVWSICFAVSVFYYGNSWHVFLFSQGIAVIFVWGNLEVYFIILVTFYTVFIFLFGYIILKAEKIK